MDKWQSAGVSDSAVDHGTVEHVDEKPNLDAVVEIFFAEFAHEFATLTMFVVFLGAPRDVAQDIAQEAIVTAWSSRHSIRSSPRAWVRTVASRLYGKWAYSEDQYVHRTLEMAGPDDAALACTARDEQKTVLRVLAQLPDAQRQVLAWYYDEYSPAEIAMHTGMSPESVHSNLYKARQTLKNRGIGSDKGGSR